MTRIDRGELFDILEDEVIWLSSAWRRDKSPKTVRQYQAVLTALVELGWRGYLDVDAELPSGLMPESYRNYVAERNAEYQAQQEQAKHRSGRDL